MPKAAKTTTTFPKVGNKIAVNVGKSQSARPQRGKLVKKGGSKGGMLEGATAAHKANVQERLGAKMAPQAILYQPNAAEAGLTQRNTVFMPSALGNRDFYLRRQYRQNT
jgi:hypothetical protein